MTTQSLITDSMRKAIGTESAALTTEIEAGAIRKFAEAIGDPNLLYRDEAAARHSRYGGIIAPPTFLRSVAIERVDVPAGRSLERVLDAGSEWEYFEPVRPGDRITTVTRLADLTERTSKAIGQMLIASYETTYTNQLGQVAARQRTAFIRY